jgi:hypothetical protein
MFLVSCCNLQLAKFLPARFSEKILRTNGRISFFGQAVPSFPLTFIRIGNKIP